MGSGWRVEAWRDVRRFWICIVAYVGVVAGSCCGGDDECDKITFKKLCCIEEI
mgnify:CR=1 FL=1